MRTRYLFLLLLTAYPTQGASGDIDQMFRLMLVPRARPPTEIEYHAKVDEEVPKLTQDEIRKLLPLAQRALASQHPKTREYGLQLFLAVAIRPAYDSAELLFPYIADLEQIVTAKADPLKELAIGVITFFHPHLPTELLKFLSSHMADADNSDEEAGLEAVALILSRDPLLTRQAIRFAENGKRLAISGRVLQQLGLMQTDDPAALSSIEASLDNQNEGVCWNEVVAVSRLPLGARARFLPRLHGMVVDTKETD